MLGLANKLNGNRFAVQALSQVEVRSAIRRRERAGDIDPKHATLLLDRFELHMKYRFARLMVTDIVVETAAQMVDRHLLRAYDAVQLATCLELKKTVTERVVFVCSDEELPEAAKLERLSTLDPITPGP
jgi:predicted nucleic acid-binding protein